MSNNIPTNKDIPSIGKLIKSTVLAIIIATLILLTVVLPAEYGLDPIGVGNVLGLTKMGEIKVSLAAEVDSEQQDKPEKLMAKIEPTEAIIEKDTGLESDRFTITLEPNQGKEIKLTMIKGATVDYNWYTNGGVANFDAHADSKKLSIKYHNYDKGQLEKNEGTMEAAFDGNHGWFWRNRTSEIMKVTLEVKGNYTDVLQF